jgi:hypothetical protein
MARATYSDDGTTEVRFTDSGDPITLRGDDVSGWTVYVRGTWIATFGSWEEARDLCVELEALLAGEWYDEDTT